MKKLIFVFIFVGAFLLKLSAQSGSSLTVNLYSLQDSILDIGRFAVVMNNVGDKPIAIIPLPCQLYFNRYIWFIDFQINHEEISYFPHIRIDHMLYKKDYKILEPDQSCEFEFTICFQELGIARIENKYDFVVDYTPVYGKYTIQLHYLDLFKKHKRYVKEEVYSNDVTVTYAKKQ